ncbi:MAG: hypothetical protein ACK5Y2_05185 [Bdellovibrionales bacterium]
MAVLKHQKNARRVPLRPILNSCRAILRSSHFGTKRGSFVLAFFLAFLLALSSPAQDSCKSVLSAAGPEAGVRTEITDLDSFGKAMSEGLLLRPEQADLFEVYRQVFFGDSNVGVGGKNLKSVNDILQKYPGLEKPLFPEFLISSIEKVYETPEPLAKFIKSQLATAGQVRSNLFQIEANLGYWKKLLDYQDPALPQGLTKDQQKQFQKRSQARFLSYLNRIISKTNRELLADLKSEGISYSEKTKALFKTLHVLESWMSQKQRNTQALRQALVDLVYTVGYGNRATVALMKSPNAMDKIQGLTQLWSEADGLAEDLGYKNHFAELKEKTRIDFPTGLSKNEDPVDLIKKFEQQVLQSPFTTKPSSSIRVRSLSIQESPFRSCLGQDCSTRTYFDKALDPNYIYFTMTDSNHRSNGHATVVLGTASRAHSGTSEKVAFLDKLQNIPTQRIEPFLAAIDQSLKTQGYRLALPMDLGKYVSGHGGLSNMDVITDYVQMHTMPRLNQVLSAFTPHPHSYRFKNSYSRADQRLEVRLFEPSPSSADVMIRQGERRAPYPAPETLSRASSEFSSIFALRA